ncbi:hypothetical protein GFK26_12570 [Variovorax paradoxus]|uniref:Uncharacterized protein n=1 Tax=Variovorax paradoxus TaxID=34073 RepID=A0A5Q0M1X6_VARPD|nr:hypothetical protein [Variovorax paradoxus]QFZ83533.1 hypothetical protein GFK26_12570 [Variovorax paradoxus]
MDGLTTWEILTDRNVILNAVSLPVLGITSRIAQLVIAVNLKTVRSTSAAAPHSKVRIARFNAIDANLDPRVAAWFAAANGDAFAAAHTSNQAIKRSGRGAVVDPKAAVSSKRGRDHIGGTSKR